jgi:hypothetical protein
MSLIMADGENANTIRQHSIVDSKWKTLQRCLAPTMRMRGEKLRVLSDQSQHSLDFLEELVAESIASLVIPMASLIDFLLNR